MKWYISLVFVLVVLLPVNAQQIPQVAKRKTAKAQPQAQQPIQEPDPLKPESKWKSNTVSNDVDGTSVTSISDGTFVIRCGNSPAPEIYFTPGSLKNRNSTWTGTDTKMDVRWRIVDVQGAPIVSEKWGRSKTFDALFIPLNSFTMMLSGTKIAIEYHIEGRIAESATYDIGGLNEALKTTACREDMAKYGDLFKKWDDNRIAISKKQTEVDKILAYEFSLLSDAFSYVTSHSKLDKKSLQAEAALNEESSNTLRLESKFNLDALSLLGEIEKRELCAETPDSEPNKVNMKCSSAPELLPELVLHDPEIPAEITFGINTAEELVQEGLFTPSTPKPSH